MPDTRQAGAGESPGVLLYIRVSSEESGKRGYSSKDQQDRLLEEAERRRWKVLEVPYIDLGYSGGFLERPALDAMRDRVERRDVRYVIACYRDRWSRGEPADMWVLTEEMKGHGCSIRSLDFQGDIDTPEGELQAGILDGFARFEKRKIAERTRRGKKRKAKDGKIIASTFPDYGFRYNSTRDGYEVVSERIVVVRRILEMVAHRGWGLTRMSKALAAEGTPSPTGKEFWSLPVLKKIIDCDCYRTYPAETLRPMLSNPHLVESGSRYGIWWFGKARHVSRRIRKVGDDGQLTYPNTVTKTPNPRNEWIAVPVPDCGIDPSLVDAARDVYHSHRKPSRQNAKRFWQLSGGILRCPHCGGAYGLGGHGRHFYYRCSTRAARGRDACSNSTHLKVSEIEARVWAFVSSLLSDPDVMERGIRAMIDSEKRVVKDPSSELKSLLKRRTKLEDGRTAVEDAYLEGIISGERTKARLARIDEDISTVEEKMRSIRERAKRVDALEAQGESLLDVYKRATPERLAALSPEQRHDIYTIIRLKVDVPMDAVMSARWLFGNVFPLDADLDSGLVSSKVGSICD